MTESTWTCDICGKVEHMNWLGKPPDWEAIVVKFGGCSRTGYACHNCVNRCTPEQGFIKYWKQVIAFVTKTNPDSWGK